MKATDSSPPSILSAIRTSLATQGSSSDGWHQPQYDATADVGRRTTMLFLGALVSYRADAPAPTLPGIRRIYEANRNELQLILSPPQSCKHDKLLAFCRNQGIEWQDNWPYKRLLRQKLRANLLRSSIRRLRIFGFDLYRNQTDHTAVCHDKQRNASLFEQQVLTDRWVEWMK